MTNPIDETLSHPGATTLDECLRRAPRSLTEGDLDHMITILRAERTQFQVKAERRDAKRQGVEDDGENNEAGVPAEMPQDDQG